MTDTEATVEEAQRQSIKPSALAVDNHGGASIVYERTDRPSQRWLKEQREHRVAFAGECDWCNVMPFSGGLVMDPQSRLQHQRGATVEGALEAVAEGNIVAAQTLSTQFPALKDVALRALADPDSP